MSTRICRDCKYRMNIANTEETGVAICSNQIIRVLRRVASNCECTVNHRRGQIWLWHCHRGIFDPVAEMLDIIEFQ